jgi:PhnB protein
VQVQPYLFFEGRCDEALEFYKKALGAKVISLRRFKESPDPNMCSQASVDKVMHASFQVGDTVIMASDGRCSGQQSYQGFALSISAPSAEEAERVFTALSEGGQVQMPMTQTFFSERFGMAADKFGMSWMVIVAK